MPSAETVASLPASRRWARSGGCTTPCTIPRSMGTPPRTTSLLPTKPGSSTASTPRTLPLTCSTSSWTTTPRHFPRRPCTSASTTGCPATRWRTLIPSWASRSRTPCSWASLSLSTRSPIGRQAPRWTLVCSVWATSCLPRCRTSRRHTASTAWRLWTAPLQACPCPTRSPRFSGVRPSTRRTCARPTHWQCLPLRRVLRRSRRRRATLRWSASSRTRSTTWAARSAPTACPVSRPSPPTLRRAALRSRMGTSRSWLASSAESRLG
mmetsp:Transcript_113803/g.368239  ORF Transcript_113803/g.368239 Transcript_113803/m.368239 type:complete len:266 (-) Transcript_113803:550-1347(-)